MARIRSKNTRPEMAVRSALHQLGFRFRLHQADMPGKPDIVFASRRLAVFVHGCFWHQHTRCRLASKPKSRQEYWGPKLAANVARDRRHLAELAAMGWRAEIIWECDARDPDRLADRLAALIRRSLKTTRGRQIRSPKRAS